MYYIGYVITSQYPLQVIVYFYGSGYDRPFLTNNIRIQNFMLFNAMFVPFSLNVVYSCVMHPTTKIYFQPKLRSSIFLITTNNFWRNIYHKQQKKIFQCFRQTQHIKFSFLKCVRTPEMRIYFPFHYDPNISELNENYNVHEA